MKAWVDYIADRADHYLWNEGNHFGDWLALDRIKGYIWEKMNIHIRDADNFGGTDFYAIAACYFAYSAKILSKSAGILGYENDRDTYEKLFLSDVCAE